jgi:2-polyprenyl-3-methyl-5-hydroxy-6-metoxy-1,4-benzoquinol methylase
MCTAGQINGVDALSEKKHVYDYDVDLSSDTAPARVIGMVRRGAKVLEIGAGPGSITRHLANTLGCQVDALEVDPAAIELLKSYGLNAYPSDLNIGGWSSTIANARGTFDYVIAADVLEHVTDPWAVLMEMKSLLNESGEIILSIPHVGHAAVVACLMDEDFEYGPWGLLDKTHIRFFGIKNVQALVNGAGLVIEEAQFVVRTPEMTEFVSRWERMPAEIRNAIQRNRFSHVLQCVVRVRPGKPGESGIDLITLTPVPPDQETVEKWTRTMQRYARAVPGDERSTIGAISLRGPRSSIFGKLKRLRKKLKRRFGL